MDFAEFKTWFEAFDAKLAGQAPELAQWWELKARLDAVNAQKPAEYAPFAEPLDVPRETEISDDVEPLRAPASSLADLDLAAFSEDKDGGLIAEAVRLHRPKRRA